MKKAKIFYSDILGLQEMERPPFFIKGLWYDLGSFELHLMLHEKAGKPSIHPLNETVQPHFALSLKEDEVALIIKRLKGAGVQFIPEPQMSPSSAKQVFFYDFDGNMLEINNEEKG